jgi:ppGpp synthetase/RelA/SpoT-type nucleotidyltranferase
LATKYIYEPAAKEIVERLITLKTVHSVKYRIKDPEHLIEKIIRKKLESPRRIYTIENYSKKSMILLVLGLFIYINQTRKK